LLATTSPVFNRKRMKGSLMAKTTKALLTRRTNKVAKCKQALDDCPVRNKAQRVLHSVALEKAIAALAAITPAPDTVATPAPDTPAPDTPAPKPVAVGHWGWLALAWLQKQPAHEGGVLDGQPRIETSRGIITGLYRPCGQVSQRVVDGIQRLVAAGYVQRAHAPDEYATRCTTVVQCTPKGTAAVLPAGTVLPTMPAGYKLPARLH
jgi:hypothetical protein